MMEEDLIAYLLAGSQVQAAVGTRVFWVQRTQGSIAPAVVLTGISGRRDYSMAGPSGLLESRVQADCYGDIYSAAKTAARAVVDRLSGASVTQGGTFFAAAFVDGERDSFEGEPKLFRTSVDLLIWHREN